MMLLLISDVYHSSVKQKGKENPHPGLCIYFLLSFTSLMDFFFPSLPWDLPDARIKMPPKCQQGNGGIQQDAVFPSRAAGRRRRPRLSSRAPSLSVPPANASAFHPPYLHHQTPPCILNPEPDLVPFLLYQFANLTFLGCHFKQCRLTPDTD